MEHVGIDLGKNHSHVALVTAQGVVKVERMRTPSLPDWLRSRPPSRVVMEASTQSHAIASAALAAGHEAVVVPGAFVRALGVGARGIKTDDRDAESLAYASLRNLTLPSSHLRSAASRERLELISARDLLLSSRRAASLHIKAWLRGKLLSLRGRANSPAFAAGVRALAVREGFQLPMPVELLLHTFVHLCEQLERLDAEIERFTASDPVCKRLMRIPGVGPVIAYAFTAYIDEPSRFGSADELASYLALVPGEATTGGKIKRTGTISAGPTLLKAMLIQGAWSMLFSAPHEPIAVWGRSIADRRGRTTAVVAMARKIATVMWSMWKNDTNYDPLRASTARAAPRPAALLPAASKPSAKQATRSTRSKASSEPEAASAMPKARTKAPKASAPAATKPASPAPASRPRKAAAPTQH